MEFRKLKCYKNKNPVIYIKAYNDVEMNLLNNINQISYNNCPLSYFKKYLFNRSMGSIFNYLIFEFDNETIIEDISSTFSRKIGWMICNDVIPCNNIVNTELINKIGENSKNKLNEKIILLETTNFVYKIDFVYSSPKTSDIDIMFLLSHGKKFSQGCLLLGITNYIISFVYKLTQMFDSVCIFKCNDETYLFGINFHYIDKYNNRQVDEKFIQYIS